MVPVAAAIAVTSLAVSARLTARFGERPVLLSGLGMITAGLVLLGGAPADGDYLVDVLPATPLLGVGFGLAMPALIALGIRDAARKTTAWRPGRSTPPSRSAVRSAFRCWPCSRRPAPRDLPSGVFHPRRR
jgi:MFS family permease